MALEQIRDELLPALFDVFGKTDINAEITVEGKCLIVSADKRGRGSPLGFAITENDIKDGRYKAIFSPACQKLKETIIRQLPHD